MNRDLHGNGHHTVYNKWYELITCYDIHLDLEGVIGYKLVMIFTLTWKISLDTILEEVSKIDGVTSKFDISPSSIINMVESFICYQSTDKI